jgi:hypothetical protein
MKLEQPDRRIDRETEGQRCAGDLERQRLPLALCTRDAGSGVRRQRPRTAATLPVNPGQVTLAGRTDRRLVMPPCSPAERAAAGHQGELDRARRAARELPGRHRQSAHSHATIVARDWPGRSARIRTISRESVLPFRVLATRLT